MSQNNEKVFTRSRLWLFRPQPPGRSVSQQAGVLSLAQWPTWAGGSRSCQPPSWTGRSASLSVTKWHYRHGHNDDEDDVSEVRWLFRLSGHRWGRLLLWSSWGRRTMFWLHVGRCRVGVDEIVLSCAEASWREWSAGASDVGDTPGSTLTLSLISSGSWIPWRNNIKLGSALLWLY